MNLEEKIKEYLEDLDSRQLGFPERKVNSINIIESHSGESNKIFFIEVNNKPFVLKINGVIDKDPSFFRGEYHKLKSLSPYNIAPQAFIYDNKSLGAPSMIIEMIPGRTLKTDEIPKKLEEIIKLLNKMARIPIDKLKTKKGFKRNINTCKDYIQIFPNYASKQLKEYVNRFGEDSLYKILELASKKAVDYIKDRMSFFDGSEMGLIHTGIHAGNIVLTPENKIRLIDWEHSSIGDRAFEISSLLRSTYLSQKQQNILFKKYKGKSGRFIERVNLYTELFKIHEVLWHAIRYDKAKKRELNLDNDKNPEYYKDLLQIYIENLMRCKILKS